MNESAKSDQAETTAPQQWIVMRYNHFDPIWRRCWDRDFYDNGRRFISYRAIEEAWISEAIESAADGVTCFMVESSWVLRHYLQRHPEHVETLRSLIEDGRFELLGSGENIVDANMIHGELLVRNLVLGTLWAESVLGVRPSTGWHSDGFGSSAQMPQIFRQCGYRWIPALDYSVPNAPYWRGLDGSTVLYSPDAGKPEGRQRMARMLSGPPPPFHYSKHPPCPACSGIGCDVCAGTGMAPSERTELILPEVKPFDADMVLLLLWGEEVLPGRHVADCIANANRAATGIEIRQGIYRDLFSALRMELDAVDDPPADKLSTRVENNPHASGCYVSRIGVKQKHRLAENSLLTAETYDALLGDGANAHRIRNAWRDLTLSAFHDAITGTHIDEAALELADLQGAIIETARDVTQQALLRVTESRTTDPNSWTVFNPTGRAASCPVAFPIPHEWPGAEALRDGKPMPVFERGRVADQDEIVGFIADIAPFGAASVTLRPAKRRLEVLGDAIVEVGGITATVGENGIQRIEVDGLGVVAEAADYNVGELILEHDDGDPWATRTLDRTRERLAQYTRLESVVRDGDAVIVSYRGEHPSNADPHHTNDPHVVFLVWRQRFVFRAGVDRVDVETEVDWYTASRRLRLAFPSPHKTDTGVYDIPYGVLERKRYEAVSTHGGNGGGDWPAVNWAGIQAPDHTFAIFNQGTPSYRIEQGTVLVSVLRSPQLPYGLLEPESYTAYNFHGMSDGGKHHFRHALSFERGDWRSNATAANAALFNRPPVVVSGVLRASLAAWRIDAPHTEVSSVKASERGGSLILRLVERSGAADTVNIEYPRPWRKWRRCNLLEDPLSEWANGSGLAIPMKPWEIATIELGV